MSLRPTLLTKWISRRSEILKPPSLASYLHPSTRPSLARRSAIFSPVTQATQRSLTTTRCLTRTRPGPSSFQFKQRRFNSRSADGGKGSGTGTGAGASDKASLSQRLKKLSREYGWAALGVYLGLSALDFPFCFAAVRLLGVERIGYYEHAVIGFVKDKLKTLWPQTKGSEAEDGQGQLAQAEERNQEEASIWTQLVFAYAIHKSFIFIRVPLTAAVTPKVVKILRAWGWNIGKRKPKSL
ncbi:Peptide alpha-N-acetyltransferase Nat2, putative [Penicillium digitatum]|uniref:Peptide alpha-N-acetyltransferase Nat2, putative n=3 Tax=Penicillium digitatum TaxID=36651 RepID=K9F853_PEND2|nr:Peptide alpha-N-acetyltransferase Nat2, putative [Penicillium digitatum Pd1]EKV05279.1 Peptide alpha-N-acetyltransferase Nat2, putative [Penicillium digitatum PHI26]EKV19827.1 Peptide alpha-N-acetyltransferase Nat2, putative [Penicillium digitatum Pd1]QQK44958.1 Peptide alpha-N-acetyltransferase Nat2, putative [Penicillium digitatum]